MHVHRSIRSSRRRWLAPLCVLFGARCGAEPPARPAAPVAARTQGLSTALTDCTAASLVKAIDDANAAGAGPHTITLMADCTYTLTEVRNHWYGPNALPAVTSDITIAGKGRSVIERSSADMTPAFRLFFVNGAPNTNVLPGAGKLTLKDLTLRNGLARGGKGGGAGGGGLGAGGAVFVHLGSVTVVNSSLVENTAVGGSGGKGATTAGNAQGGSALGGGLFNLAGSVQLVHATLARNTVQAGTNRTPEAAGGAACNVGFGLKSTDGSESNGVLTLRNSVLAGSQGGADLLSIRDMGHGAAQANTDGGGKNYVQAAANRGAADTTVPQPADPMLGMLTVTGGPTATAAPLAGSPLIGGADPAVCSAEPARGIDQRGARRGDRCTLGAFESEPAPGSDTNMNTGTQPPADSGGCSTVPGRAPGAGGGVALALGLGAAVLLGLTARRRRRSGGHWTA